MSSHSARPGLVAACVLVMGLGAATLLWDTSLVTILTLHAGRRGHSQGRGADDDEGVWAGVIELITASLAVANPG